MSLGCRVEPEDHLPKKPTADAVREESVEAAVDGDIQKRAGDLVDESARSLSKYINKLAGDQMIAEPDNEIRRIMMEMLVKFEDRSKNEG